MGQVASRDTIREWRGHFPTFRPVPTNNVWSAKCSRFAQRWIGRAGEKREAWRGRSRFCHREKKAIMWMKFSECPTCFRFETFSGAGITRADGRRGSWKDKQAGRLTDRQTEIQTDRQKYRQKYRQTDRQKYRHGQKDGRIDRKIRWLLINRSCQILHLSGPCKGGSLAGHGCSWRCQPSSVSWPDRSWRQWRCKSQYGQHQRYNSRAEWTRGFLC